MGDGRTILLNDVCQRIENEDVVAFVDEIFSLQFEIEIHHVVQPSIIVTFSFVDESGNNGEIGRNDLTLLKGGSFDKQVLAVDVGIEGGGCGITDHAVVQ